MEENYEVEKILNHKTFNDGGGDARYFLIKWKGYDVSEATWEPECHLTDCDMKITSYFLESKRREFQKGTYRIRINLLHNHLLDETEKMSSMALDLKRKLDNIEFELERPPRPMLKKRILAKYEKLPKMGRTKETEVTVPISVNNNKSPVKNDRLEIPKKREQSTYISAKTKSKSKLSEKSSKKSKEKYSRLDGFDRQHKIKKIIVEPKIPKENKKTKDSRLNRKRTLAETLCQNADPFGCPRSGETTSDLPTKIHSRIKKRPKLDMGNAYEQMRLDFMSAHSSTLKRPLSQAQRDAYEQILDEF